MAKMFVILIYVMLIGGVIMGVGLSYIDNVQVNRGEQVR